MIAVSTRQGIYYWKCDRPAAFHGTAQGTARAAAPGLEEQVRGLLRRQFRREPEALRDAGGQGNHRTFVAGVGSAEYFVRLEDGPEGDDYLAVESHVLATVRARGVPAPRVFATDASRREVPFAWQILDLIPEPDLNRHFKAGTLATEAIAEQLGRLVALWQEVAVTGFGPFDTAVLSTARQLTGLHSSYASYFYTRLEEHLAFLVARDFLAPAQAEEMRAAIAAHRARLVLAAPCLVHKDLALWNVLGTERTITAVIDWDDCVGGDPTDDLALLGCFHDGASLRAAVRGYEAVRRLPADWVPRFWLHLLRNLIFKAVIRVGAGYFNHDSRFFLIGARGDGAAFRQETRDRLTTAVAGLRVERDPFSL